MAKHGKHRHLKRMAAPTAIGIPHKGGSVWLKKPIPGKHSQKQGIPLVVLLRERLHIAETSRQARRLITSGEVLVDGARANGIGIPVGLMDAVSIPKLKAFYRMVFVKGGVIFPLAITADKAGEKFCKITGKTIVRKGKIQLNLHDGRVYLIEKEEDRFHPGDTVVLNVSRKKQELKTFLKLEKGARCYVYKGRHCGTMGVLEEIMPREGSKGEEARLKTLEGAEFVTLKGYLFVVDAAFKIS